MGLFGSLATLRAQAPRNNGFDTAFAYVEELLREGSPANTRLKGVPAGESQKVELGGGVFVSEQAYESRLRADSFFESHRKYIDVQVVIEGEETMEVADITRMTVKKAYNSERDLIVYEDNTESSSLRVYPGLAAIFFPADVHMPGLRNRADAVLVRKAVVKIPVA